MKMNLIEGSPTKTFFIEMITRDISIEDAIIDLLDNSIDGANRINPNDYSGLEVDIRINKDEFCIKDNCGGFSLNTAIKYAFRFGRPDDAPKEDNTIGRFGIGMKRSLFKIGKFFVVESETTKEHFKVEVDVDQWSKKKRTIIEGEKETIVDDWSFNYSLIEEKNGSVGTTIRVSNLNKEVKELFSDSAFLSELAEDIQRLLNFSLQKGIRITLNGRVLEGKKIVLLFSDDRFSSYYMDGVIGDVKYRIVAGLGEIGEPKDSGWYIYCNNRLVLEADTSSLTGWGLSPIPKWHINHVMFRGLLFLDAKETLKLPLTTTKKGIDATSEVYTAVLPQMQHAMIQVLDFLKRITQMGDKANEYRRLLCEVCGRKTALEFKDYDFQGETQRHFTPPELDLDIIAQKRETVRIAFDADKRAANAAKSYSDTHSFKELGLTCFLYYLQMEGIKYEESKES